MTDQPPQKPPFSFVVKRHFQIWPVTCTLVLLGALGTLIEWLDVNRVIFFHFTFVGVEQTSPGYGRFLTFQETYFQAQQWWRLITPAFLHFGPFHLLFNSLALWELGRRLEYHWSPARYALFCLATGVVSNYIQFKMTDSASFGGLSGIVFAVIGAIAICRWRTKAPVLALPIGLYVLAGASLIIGFTPLFPLLFGVGIANGAHLGGLLSGLVLAGLLSIQKSGKQNER